MRAIKLVAVLLVVVLVGAWLSLKCLTVDIPLGKVGVRTNVYALIPGTKEREET